MTHEDENSAVEVENRQLPSPWSYGCRVLSSCLRAFLLPLCLLLALLLAGSALAVDGVAEINHTRAVQTGAGIFASLGSSIQRSTIRSNGFGLSLDSSCLDRENVISGNADGTVFRGVNLGDNSCNGTTTCP